MEINLKIGSQKLLINRGSLSKEDFELEIKDFIELSKETKCEFSIVKLNYAHIEKITIKNQKHKIIRELETNISVSNINEMLFFKDILNDIYCDKGDYVVLNTNYDNV